MTGQSSEPATYEGWRRERLGAFAGLTGGQAALVAALSLPPLLAMGRSDWGQVLQLLPLSVIGAALVVVPVRGRPAFRWLFHLTLFHLGAALGWSRWRSQASTGAASAEELEHADLPGVIAGLRTHVGPPFGPSQTPVCLVQDPTGGRWAVTARIVHPGVAGADSSTREGFASALGDLLASAAESGVIDGLSLMIRTIPDDGAERAAWVADHEVAHVAEVVAAAGRDLEATVVAASVRHEMFLTIRMAEGRIRRPARDCGGGAAGRATVIYRYLAEFEHAFRSIGATDVQWLDSADLATAIRTGYNLSEGASVARAAHARRRSSKVSTGTQMGAAGPSVAPAPGTRAYVHDAYTTVSYALLLPKRPTTVGSLSRLLAPAVAGERRCLAMHYEPLPANRADRQIDRDTWSAEMAVDIKAKRGFRVPRRDRKRLAEVAEQEKHLARGHTLVRVAGAVAVTVPSGSAVDDAAASFEGSARASGYQLLRLDLAQDAGFVAAVLPLGVGLPRRGDR